MIDKLFFIDAETDGLYGAFISVSIVVVDKKSGNIIEKLYYGINKEKLEIKEEWVRKNVLPILGDYEACETEEELLEKVWSAWDKYRESAYAIADVTFPVEARLFSECVKLDELNRRFIAPFPLLDLSSLLYACGYDPLVERKKIIENMGNNHIHNAEDDNFISIEVYGKIIGFR